MVGKTVGLFNESNFNTLLRTYSISRYLKSVGDIRSIVAIFKRSQDICAATYPRNYFTDESSMDVARAL